MNRRAILTGTMLASVLILGCVEQKKDPAKPEPQGNPITSASGPIGQGGDAAAMATRRAAQQMKAVNDMKQIALFFTAYRDVGGTPSADGFLKYLEQDKDARVVNQAIKEGRYVVNVPRMLDSTWLLAYEKEPDFQGTRVVVMSDGAVTKTMPEAEFQKLLKSK